MILLNTHPASERLKRAKSRNCQNDRERIGMFGYEREVRAHLRDCNEV